MQLIRGLHNLTQHNGCAVTIGNFDGVHKGHKKIINQLVKKAKTLGIPSVLISFSPTPQTFFGKAQATISNFKEKHQLLAKLGLTKHLIIKFDKKFSQLEAADFIRQILLEKLNTQYCLIGYDFRFGADRGGNFALLKGFGFAVESASAVLCQDKRISSSEIRCHLKSGDLTLAGQMLGYEFSISGNIIHGKKQGRTIGFPTINIPIKRKISPVLGVFAVNLVLNFKTYQGVCNIGKRPTIGGNQTLLEVFLFDFKQTVYGQNACVVFKHKIRDEQKFTSFDALKKQIILDSKNAQEFFKHCS